MYINLRQSVQDLNNKLLIICSFVDNHFRDFSELKIKI